MALLLIVVVKAVIFPVTTSHALCLNSLPPIFNSNQLEYKFCNEYSRSSCCTEGRDIELKALYEGALKKVRSKTLCQEYLRQVMCLECHPYASRIFDTKSNPKAAIPVPCLEEEFCNKYLIKNCGPAVQYIWGDTIKLRNITLSRFCAESKHGLSRDFCYPTVREALENVGKLRPGNIAYGSAMVPKLGCLCVREVTKNLRSALALTHANDGTHRMFIVERPGLVHILLHNGSRLDMPFMNITAQTLTSSAFEEERGLLGMTFHPNYLENGRLFVYYITSRDGSPTKQIPDSKAVAVLSEWRVSSKDANKVDPSSEKVLIKLDQPEKNHNGGTLLFGKDEYLYLFLGDGGGAGDPFGQFGNGQNKSTLLGKVLRIDVDSTTNDKGYNIPHDNPFINESQARPEIYAYGFRNPWRCSVDRGDKETGYGQGRIFCGDVGQDRYEEIDIVTKGGNYGWRGREGFECYDKDICKSNLLANEILPIYSYNHSVGQSIVGGYVYRGCNFPNMRGLYFYADTITGRIFTLNENKTSGKWHSREVCMGDSLYCKGNGVSGKYASLILSFGEDESGELYFLSTEYTNSNEGKGAVYQLIDRARQSDLSECKVTVKKSEVMNTSSLARNEHRMTAIIFLVVFICCGV